MVKDAKHTSIELVIDGQLECERECDPWTFNDQGSTEHRVPELHVTIDVYEDGTAKVRLPGYPATLGASEVVLEAVRAIDRVTSAIRVRVSPTHSSTKPETAPKRVRACGAVPRGGDGSLVCSLPKGHKGNHKAEGYRAWPSRRRDVK